MTTEFQQREHLFIRASEVGVSIPKPKPHPERHLNQGPDTGYDNEAKAEWRDRVWWSFGAATGQAWKKSVNVFFIESLDGLEIEKALKLGYAEKRLHVCNGNPAVVASLKRRYKRINTYGVSAERALLRIAKRKVPLHFADLDFCSCLSKSVIETIHAARHAVADNAIVAINVMRGRERKWTNVKAVPSGGAVDGFYNFLKVSNGGMQRKLDELKPSDRIRHLWLAVSIAIGPTDYPIESSITTAENITEESLPEGYRDRPNYDPREMFIVAGNTPSRKGKIMDFGSYKTGGGLTMGWVIIFTTFGINAVGVNGISKRGLGRSPKADAKLPKQPGTELKSTGFRV